MKVAGKGAGGKKFQTRFCGEWGERSWVKTAKGGLVEGAKLGPEVK